MITKNKITSIILIQAGDNTHNHDQLITPVNFNAINRMVNNPVKPIPLEEDDELE